jgi:hypothetical protein
MKESQDIPDPELDVLGEKVKTIMDTQIKKKDRTISGLQRLLSEKNKWLPYFRRSGGNLDRVKQGKKRKITNP